MFVPITFISSIIDVHMPFFRLFFIGPVSVFLLSAVFAILFESLTAVTQFTEVTVLFVVSEQAPIATRIGDIYTASNDVVKPPLISLESIPSNFNLDLSTGILTTADVLDREYASSYNFLIFYGDEGNLAKIVVNVLDENDNVPQFESTHLEFNVSELTHVPKCWSLPVPKDADEAKNSVVSCKLIDEARFPQFTINYDKVSLRLSLCLVEKLDFEITPGYNLTIRATDGGGKFADLLVSIEVLDENDNVPTFDAPKYEASVDWNDLNNGRPLIFMKAVDRDSGDNGLVRYAVSQRFANSGLPFKVDSVSGIISLNASSSALAEATSYSFVVRALDGGNPSLESEVPVFIRVTNNARTNKAPSFGGKSEVPSFRVHRDYPPGSYVGDLKSLLLGRNNSSLSLSLVSLSGGSFASFLTLDRITSVVTLSRWLPCDLTTLAPQQKQQRQHLFRLRLDGTRGLVPEADFTISVDDDADSNLSNSCLAFQRPLYEFLAAQRGDYCFGRVQAVTSNRCASIRYSVAATQVPIAINQSTGALCLPPAANFTQLNRIVTFQVAASNDQQTVYSIIRVEFISETNQHANEIVIVEPVEESLNVTLPPNAKSGDLLFALRSSLEGQIVDLSTESPRHFKIAPSKLALVLAEPLLTKPVFVSFRSTKSNRRFRLRVSSACPSLKLPQKLSLEPIDIALPSSSETSNVLVRKSANQPNFFYALDQRCQPFGSISPESGVIHFSQVEEPTECRIFALSALFNESVATIRFVFPANSSSNRLVLAVCEDAPIGTLVGVIPPSMRDQSHSSRFFTLDPVSGSIRVARQLDRESQSSHLLGSVLVRVDDVNDNPPRCLFPDGFTREVFVPDMVDDEKEFYLGRLRAWDGDFLDNGTIGNFSISNDDHPFMRVDPTTGDLFLMRNLSQFVGHFSGLRKMLVKFSVSDRGIPPQVADCFTKLVFRTADNVTVAHVAKPLSTPVRLGQPVSLPFLLPSDGDISIVANFDGPLCEYLRVIPGPSTFSVVTEVRLDSGLFDRLSCAFYLSANRIVIPFTLTLSQSNRVAEMPRSIYFETSRSTSLIGQLPNGPVELIYCSLGSFVSLDRNYLVANWHLFPLNGPNHVYCLVSVNRERLVSAFISIKPDFDDLQTSKRDEGETSEPQFIFPLSAYISKHVNGFLIKPGQPVVSALAHCNAGPVTYTLENSYDGLFEIDAMTGLVTFSRSPATSGLFLPSSTINVRLVLLAKCLLQRATSEFTFEVEWPNHPTVTNVVDLTVLASAPVGTVIGRLPVELLFPGETGPIDARIIRPADSPIAISQPPGWAISTRAIGWGGSGYKGRVAVPLILTSRNNNDTKKAVLVRIHVKELNKAALMFQEKTVHLTVQENIDYKNLFQTIAFHDEDEGLSTIHYSFSGDVSTVEGGLFEIDRASGVVSCRPLDRETSTVYNLTIFATDGVHPNASMQLVLTILDANDNAPVVAKNRFDISLSGRERVGDKIFQVVASDADSNQQRLVFSLEDGFSLFQLDASTGDIRLNQLPPQNSKITEWQLKIDVSDSVHSTPVAVVVHLEPEASFQFVANSTFIADYPFAMSHQKAYVKEGMPKGAVVARVANKHDSVRFSIKSGNSDQAFAMDGPLVRTRTMLDAEIRALYTLEIVALDEAAEIGTCELSIFVIDINDNEPSLTAFAPSDHLTTIASAEFDSVVVRRSARPGTRLGTLLASDPDASSWLSYSLDGEAANYLVVNPVSGDIFLKRRLPIDRVVSGEFGVSDSFHRANTRKMTFTTSSNGDPSPETEKSKSSIFLEKLASQSVFSVQLRQCNDPIDLFSSFKMVKFEIVAQFKGIFAINESSGVISLRSHSTTLPDRVDLIVSVQNEQPKYPLFLLVTVSDLKKCSVQPLISTSSVSSVELPWQAVASLKPGSVLTKLDLFDAPADSGVFFDIQSGPTDRFFGFDGDWNLRLLRPLPIDFDATLKIVVINPVSKLSPNNPHTIRIHVLGATLAPSGGESLEIVEFQLGSSSKSLLTFSDFTMSKPVIAKSSLAGSFSIVEGGSKLGFSSSLQPQIDHYAIISLGQSLGTLIVLIRGQPTKQQIVEFSEIAEAGGQHMPNGQFVDCETVCCYATSTSENVPHLIRVVDSEEFPFGYEKQNFEFQAEPTPTQSLIGCLSPVDFDGGAAGIWRLSPVDNLPSCVNFSPFEGCLYLTGTPTNPTLEFSVAHHGRDAKTTRVTVHFSTPAPPQVLVDIPVDDVDTSRELTQVSNSPIPHGRLIMVLSTAVPLGCLVVLVLLGIAVYFHRRWLRLAKMKHDTSSKRRKDDDDDDDDGWIYRVVSALSSKPQKTITIGRTNSFNSIGFTSVRYEPRPPSRSSVALAEKRTSFCASQQQQHRLSTAIYHDLDEIAAAGNPTDPSFGFHVTPCSNGHIAVVTTRGGSSSISSGVDVSSSASSGANSCSPPPVVIATSSASQSSTQSPPQQPQQPLNSGYYLTTGLNLPTSHSGSFYTSHHPHNSSNATKLPFSVSYYSTTGGLDGGVIYSRCSRAPREVDSPSPIQSQYV